MIVVTDIILHAGGAAHQLPLSTDDVLPRIAQLFEAHGLDEEVDGAVGDAAQHDVRVAVAGHHCDHTPPGPLKNGHSNTRQ